MITRRNLLKAGVILPAAMTMKLPLSWTEQLWIQKLKKQGYLIGEKIIVKEMTYLPEFPWTIMGCRFTNLPGTGLVLPNPKIKWFFGHNYISGYGTGNASW